MVSHHLAVSLNLEFSWAIYLLHPTILESATALNSLILRDVEDIESASAPEMLLHHGDWVGIELVVIIFVLLGYCWTLLMRPTTRLSSLRKHGWMTRCLWSLLKRERRMQIILFSVPCVGLLFLGWIRLGHFLAQWYRSWWCELCLDLLSKLQLPLVLVW